MLQHLGNLTPQHIPPRSRLYNLEPAGIRTAYVESLTGYVARLAEEHATTLYYLFSEEVAPLINKPGTISHSVSFPSFAKAADGMGVIAADLVETFEKLTSRPDLRFTTMLPWAGVLSSKSLTREWRAWCPACYWERTQSGNEVYDQLLWRLQSVTACIKHNMRLEYECPNCGKRQLPLSHCIRPGFCGRCRAWLGRQLKGDTHITWGEHSEAEEGELRDAEQVGRLLEAAPDLLPSMMPTCFAANIHKYFGDAFRGRGVPSRARLPVDKQTIRCWLKRTQTPSLPLLLKTSAVLEVSPADLFRGEVDEERACGLEVNEKQNSAHTGLIVEGGLDGFPVNWQDVESVTRVEKRLRTALEDDPPPSLISIAKEFRCDRATLRKKFPKLSAQLTAKTSAYFRPKVSNERMGKEIRSALRENPPLPLESVSRRLGPGASPAILHKNFPKESRRIVERYCSHAKRRLDNKEIKKKMRAALRRNPPPSMPEVSRETGVARATLHRKFPDLSKAISMRFATHRRQRDAQNREKARAEIKSICERALQEGVYPGDSLVRSRLTIPCRSQAISEIRREVIAAMTSPDDLKTLRRHSRNGV